MFDLKPCPFCGGKARLFVNGGVRVVCTRCYVSTRVLKDELEYASSAVELSVKTWNRRAENGRVH